VKDLKETHFGGAKEKRMGHTELRIGKKGKSGHAYVGSRPLSPHQKIPDPKILSKQEGNFSGKKAQLPKPPYFAGKSAKKERAQRKP